MDTTESLKTLLSLFYKIFTAFLLKEQSNQFQARMNDTTQGFSCKILNYVGSPSQKCLTRHYFKNWTGPGSRPGFRIASTHTVLYRTMQYEQFQLKRPGIKLYRISAILKNLVNCIYIPRYNNLKFRFTIMTKQ
jgi:hypothetical protein